MVTIAIAKEEEYEPMMELFLRNDLEISEEEPVPTDLIRCWKAESEDGKMVGGCSLAVREEEYIIDGIAVEPEYRMDKTASRLLTEAMDEVKRRNGKRIYLVARAPGFFRKHGFVTIEPETAPDFFECRTCPQFNTTCFPEVMRLEIKQIFEPITIKDITLKNRLVKAATWEGLATEDGHMTPDLYRVYEELAQGGCGLIFTGYAYVREEEKPNPGMMGIYEDSLMEDYKKLTDMVHRYDTKIMMQIVYGGSMTGLVPPSPLIWGPSAVENEMTKVTPTEMTVEDIKTLIQSFAEAALRVKTAGFDGVVLHSAHGYMLSQFLAPHFNRRTDEYGGSVEKRARFLLEVVAAVRETVGEEYPLLVKLNSEDFFDGGLSAEESLEIAKMLENAGVDAIEVSGGNGSIKSVVKANLGTIRKKVNQSKELESYFQEHGKKLADTLSIPVILTGGNRSLEVMNRILNSSNIAAFGLARPLLREPDLARRWQEGDETPSKCISCGKCFKTHGKRCTEHLL